MTARKSRTPKIAPKAEPVPVDAIKKLTTAIFSQFNGYEKGVVITALTMVVANALFESADDKGEALHGLEETFYNATSQVLSMMPFEPEYALATEMNAKMPSTAKH